MSPNTERSVCGGESRSSSDWKGLIDVDLPEIGPVTTDVVKKAHGLSDRIRGSVRLALGLIWTDKDYEEYRNKVLKRPLP
ncbi:MAG: hypothetical protein AMXMBFR82_29100 [Candidatus Hydrogenedentota bacterium]